MRGYFEGKLQVQNAALHFVQFGQGPKLLIAFHGYAEQGTSFLALREALAADYTVIALDLPFHGQSRWPREAFLPEELKGWIQLLLEKENQTSFELMGYSLGGRLALAMVDHFADELQGLWLIAPDGLENRWVDRMMKVPRFARRQLFRWVQEPAWLIKLAKTLYRWKLVTGFVPKFLQAELSTPARRARAFGIWATLDYFHLQALPRLKKKLLARELKLQLFFGAQDRIIPAHLGERLAKDAPHIKFHLLPGGHHVLHTSLNTYLVKHKSSS